MSYRSNYSASTTGTWEQQRKAPAITNDVDSALQPGLVDCVVGHGDFRCRVIAKLSSGSFGDVYMGRKQVDDEAVAIKAEKSSSFHQNQVLLNEGNVYRQLENGPGIPRVFWFGIHHSGYNVLVMDLLGPSLDQMFGKLGNRFSLSTVLLLADQIFKSLEFVHSRGFVHRDISPNNFMVGGTDPTRIFLIDFGHAKKYATGFYVKPMQRRVSIAQTFVGTPRFASLATHMGKEPGRRDDLESLGYLFVYFLKGSLPWQGLQASDGASKLAQIMQLKASTSAAVLCEGLPDVFACYLEALRLLGQLDTPPYSQIRAMFTELAKCQNVSYDNRQFDWLQTPES